MVPKPSSTNTPRRGSWDSSRPETLSTPCHEASPKPPIPRRSSKRILRVRNAAPDDYSDSDYSCDDEDSETEEFMREPAYANNPNYTSELEDVAWSQLLGRNNPFGDSFDSLTNETEDRQGLRHSDSVMSTQSGARDSGIDLLSTLDESTSSTRSPEEQQEEQQKGKHHLDKHLGRLGPLKQIVKKDVGAERKVGTGRAPIAKTGKSFVESRAAEFGHVEEELEKENQKMGIGRKASVMKKAYGGLKKRWVS
jgi:hypothetical protein